MKIIFLIKKMFKKCYISYLPRILIAVLFLGSFLIRFVNGDFEKIILFYPDELRYYQIAENMARGNFLIINNEAVSYQKILYSLFLTPIFWIENLAIRAHLFSALNAFFVSSIIFPVYLIGKLLLKKYIYILCFLSLLLSDLVYSITFMSEVLFLPLGAWGVYIALKMIVENRKNIWLSIFFGFLIYILYWCKEIGVVFLLSFFAYLFFASVFKLEINLKAQIQNAIVAAFAFFAVFMFLKLTLFYGMPNSYAAQTGFSVFKEDGRLPFLFYGFGYYLMHVIMAGLFFLFAVPMLYFKNLNLNAKRLYLFIILIILLSAAVVAFTITVREDFAQVFPRAHLRYLVYIWAPMLAIFLSMLEENNFPKIVLKQKILLFFFAVFLTVFYIGANHVGDHTMLAFLRNAEKLWRFKILLLIALLVFYFYPKRRYFCIAFLIVFSIVQFFNSRHSIRIFKPFYQISAEEKVQIQKMRDFIKNNPNKNFLVADQIGIKSQRAADTFLNEANVKTVYFDSFKNNADAFENIDYFIFNAENNFNFNKTIPKENLQGVLWKVLENPR